MDVYLSIKFHYSLTNARQIQHISRIFANHGHNVFCVTRDLERWGRVKLELNDLMDRSFETIRASDVVLVELTEKGVGVGIEAGYAFAIQKPIVTITQTNHHVSDTLRGISVAVFDYASEADLDGIAASLEYLISNPSRALKAGDSS